MDSMYHDSSTLSNQPSIIKIDKSIALSLLYTLKVTAQTPS